jgi:hypothetical protein
MSWATSRSLTLRQAVAAPPVLGGQIDDGHDFAGAHGGEAGPVVMTVLHLIEVDRGGVAAGHSERPAVTAQGDPARQPGPHRVGGVMGHLYQELGEALGVDQ